MNGPGSRTVAYYLRSFRTKPAVRRGWRSEWREGDWPRGMCNSKTGAEHCVRRKVWQHPLRYKTGNRRYVKRKTANKKFTAKLTAFKEWLMKSRTMKTAEL